jgi:hypothetical protein
MLYYLTSTLLLFSLFLSVETTRPQTNPYRNFLQNRIKLQTKALLAKSRITFAKDIQEVNEELFNLGGLTNRWETQEERDSIMLNATTKWAVKNLVWITDVACPETGCDHSSMEYMNETTIESLPKGVSEISFEEEVVGGANELILLQCSNCSIPFRCLRYRDIKKVMGLRYGLCEEMSTMFALITGLMGLKSRVVDAWGDNHTWTEVLIEKKWVPVDISELKGKWVGEKSEFNWVLAYDDGKVIDVTEKYAGSKEIVDKRRARDFGTVADKVALVMEFDVNAPVNWLMMNEGIR